MKKTWRNVILVSLLLIALEVVGMYIFLYPPFKTYRLFDSIEDGQWKITKEYYDKMSTTEKIEVDKYLDSFAAWACKGYINGERDYEHTAAILDAINSVQTDGEIYNKYMNDVNHNEYKKAVYLLWNAYMAHDNAQSFEAQNMINAVVTRMETKTRDAFLIEILNEGYAQFLEDKMDTEKIYTLCSLVENNSYYEAHDYSMVISDKINFVTDYRNQYSEIEKLCNENEYFNVMIACTTATVDPEDKVYIKKYADLYQLAYDQGLIYYKDKITSLINAGDKDGAIQLMNTVVSCYGDAFDVSFARDAMTNDWQKAYMEIVENADSIILSDLTTLEYGNQVIAQGYDSIKPDSIVFYDIDENGIPEMFLFNSAHLENDYVGCFLFSYDGQIAQMSGYVKLVSLCSDSSLIVVPMSSGSGEAYALMSFDKGMLTEGDTCQHVDDKYYVNYSESNDVDYLSLRTAILGHESMDTFKTVGYANISDGDNYIMAYK